jgi:hypothetical protein
MQLRSDDRALVSDDRLNARLDPGVPRRQHAARALQRGHQLAGLDILDALKGVVGHQHPRADRDAILLGKVVLVTVALAAVPESELVAAGEGPRVPFAAVDRARVEFGEHALAAVDVFEQLRHRAAQVQRVALRFALTDGIAPAQVGNPRRQLVEELPAHARVLDDGLRADRIPQERQALAGARATAAEHLVLGRLVEPLAPRARLINGSVEVHHRGARYLASFVKVQRYQLWRPCRRSLLARRGGF